MNDQDTYDRTLDAPPGPPAPVAPALPNEEYYRRVPEPQPNGRRRGLGIALVLVGSALLVFQGFGFGPAIGGGGTTTVVDKTLPGSRIELSATSADVEIRTWNEPGIHIEAIQRGGSSGDYTVDVSQSGDTVRVTEASRGVFCLFCSRSLRFRISAPAAAQADIHTTSGDIDLAGLGGAVALGSVSGDVRAEDVAGGLTVGTTSGDVRLQAVAGHLDVSTISGDVRLDDGKVDGAIVKTTSGDVNLDGVGGALNLSSVSGDLTVQDARDSQLTVSTTSGEVKYDGLLASGSSSEISSISGDVTLDLPSDAGFNLNASTVSGDLSSEFSLSGGEAGRRTLTGAAGDGSAALKVGTTSGDIQIKRR